MQLRQHSSMIEKLQTKITGDSKKDSNVKLKTAEFISSGKILHQH